MSTPLLRLALPKGRMQDAVFKLLADAGLAVRATSEAVVRVVAQRRP
jgi:ATP phosphoribosyltransferase